MIETLQRNIGAFKKIVISRNCNGKFTQLNGKGGIKQCSKIEPKSLSSDKNLHEPLPVSIK